MPPTEEQFMEWLSNIPVTKQQEVFNHFFTEFLKEKGKLFMWIVIGTGIFLTAVVGIFGSLKAIIGYFGFSIMRN